MGALTEQQEILPGLAQSCFLIPPYSTQAENQGTPYVFSHKEMVRLLLWQFSPQLMTVVRLLLLNFKDALLPSDLLSA